MPPDLKQRRDLVRAWAEPNRRDLPWRATRDPWKVLVSELMLQQTQVTRVIPKYLAFVQAYPTPGACASAARADVLRHWAGLGYNRRAVHLHQAAIEMEARHGGRVPDDYADLVALPGIGPYTARAVLAFAFERDVGVVDTNVARVLARWCGRTLGRREVQELADDLVPAGEAWSWNQAMLDLGATVCTKRAPRCDECPTRSSCGWYARALDGPDPADGTAGVPAPQSPFAGSDRQGRGRLVDALRSHGVVARADLAEAAGWPNDTERAARVAAGLVRDGLAAWADDGALTLPA